MTGETAFLLVLAHLIGDYVLQSDWMATRKVKPGPNDRHGHAESWLAAIVHGLTYGLPFLLVTQSPAALAAIVGTHIVLDHYRLAKQVIWLRNHFAPRGQWIPWAQARTNGGMPAAVPAGLATAMVIVVDNTIHLAINAAAVAWLA